MTVSNYLEDTLSIFGYETLRNSDYIYMLLAVSCVWRCFGQGKFCVQSLAKYTSRECPLRCHFIVADFHPTQQDGWGIRGAQTVPETVINELLTTRKKRVEVFNAISGGVPVKRASTPA